MIGWLKKTFGSEPPKTVSEVMSVYGGLIEKYPLAIIDSSMLPITKTKMKALLKVLYARAGSAEEENLYETGFMFLSKFQDGVGAVPIDGKLINGDIMENLPSNMAVLDKWMSWEKLSLAEMEILTTEWKRFKDGEPI